MNKRRIALFIILSVLLSAAVTTAAEPLTDIANNPHRKAIEQMAELGVLAGKGGGLFWPGDNLTRAEAAKVAMFLAGFDEADAAQAKALSRTFDDVYAGMGNHEWALGWTNLAVREGIIDGYGDGTYGPGDTLTMAQWAAILIRTLGYETKGLAWPAGYDQLAGELGLTEELQYMSSFHIRRDQMARFTANAVYRAERPDGSKIIDLWGGRPEDKPGNSTGSIEDQQRGDINLSVAFSPQILPEGGGQTSAITVTVTDKAGKPVKDAKVWFLAEVFEGVRVSDRNAQLSQIETYTNTSGKAIISYTSLAADNKKPVFITASASKDSVDVHGKFYQIIAANQAAVISGTVRDPYTGIPKGGVSMHVRRDGTDHSFSNTETDDQGYYSLPVPTGTYNVFFDMPIKDQITVNASGHGKTYTVDNNKGILKGVVTGAGSGKMVMALAPDFRHSPDAWTLQANIQSDGSFVLALAPGTYELFVVGSSNPSKTGITVQSGRVTDIGTVNAR
ncbi:MAG: carboxypeptidase regulatory-like domain-containing protein [Anaerovoracaceae bacterium]